MLSTTPALQLRDVSKRFGATTALDRVSLSCLPGQVCALVGENGAGKSTLLGILAGAHQPDSGEVLIDGSPIDFRRHSPWGAQRLGIAVVHQEFALIESMSVAENIFLGREPRRGIVIDRQEMNRRAAEILESLGAEFPPSARVERLSVAQAQLVEIAKALAFDSRILALDEPSAVLGGSELDALFSVVRRLTQSGVTVIYVSHRMDEIFDLCDQYVVLKDGLVTGSGRVAETNRGDLIRLMVGREVSDTFPERSTGTGRVRLRVREVAVTGKLAGISLDVREGEIVGLAGLMGSGRTVLAKAIFGQIPVSSGEIEVDGQRGPFKTPAQAVGAGLAYIPEDRKREGLALGQSIRWNATLLALPSLRRALGLVSTRLEEDLVARLTDDLDIRLAAGSQRAGQLSGGNQQKLVMGKWLEIQPKVLIMDEPTRGIDVGSKEQIYRLLRKLADQGLAILAISSELIELLGLCDRILVLSQGRLVGELGASEASEEAIMQLAVTGPSVATGGIA